MKAPFVFRILMTAIVMGGMLPAGRSQAEQAATRFVIAGPDQVLDGWVNRQETSFIDAELHNHGAAWVNYHRCLIRFDLGAIDPDRFGRVGKATLRLAVTEAGNAARKMTTVAPSTRPWTDQATFGTADGQTPWPASKGDHNIEWIDAQVAELRAHAREMPGIAFYGNTDEELARACDRAARKHFVDPAPEVFIVEPGFQDHLTTPHVTIRAEARPRADRTISRFRWFIDNRLVAETETPCCVWDLRGEHAGHHILAVHAIDSAFNRAATQIPVRITR